MPLTKAWWAENKEKMKLAMKNRKSKKPKKEAEEEKSE